MPSEGFGVHCAPLSLTVIHEQLFSYALTPKPP
jgi:hypothetical protein